ncbi:MAG: adenylate/guanylate cyclase domain-containing protein, partial [Methyloligellaceae bacterium]
MSVALGLGLGFFVLTAVAGVLGIGLVIGYQNTIDLLRQKAELLIRSERNWTRQFLESAEHQITFISGQIASGEIEPSADEEFTSLLLGALAATPQIIRIQFIDTQYRLVGAVRRTSRNGETMPVFRSVRGDDKLKGLLDRAKTNREPYWGALLWLQDHKQAVLNYHQPVLKDGALVGVASAFVSIRQLSEAIADLQTDFGANAFILHGRDAVLAHPLMAFGYAGLTGLTPLPRQKSFADPVIVSMWDPPDRASLAHRIISGPGVNFAAFGDQTYIILHQPLEGFTDKPLLVGTYFESHDLLSEAFRLRWAFLVCLVMSAISALVAAYIGSEIARPVRRLADGSKRIHDLDFGSVEQIPGSFFRELNDAAHSFNTMLDGLRWFERYVPKTLVTHLIRLHPDEAIESTYREVVVMFTDIVGFTTISEAMTAPTTADFLIEHFTMIADCVEAEGGTVDKYMGDSVMAIWGAPELYEDAADRACHTVLAIADAIRHYNTRQEKEGGPQVRLTVGIHLGRVVVGNIGSPGRLNYTVVGDSVNVAQRLQEAGKFVGNVGA